MTTIFSIPKPFLGHAAVIQRNAIRSWTRLKPHCQIILCGDDPGVADAASEFGLGHISGVDRNEWGTPLVHSLFAAVESAATDGPLAYVNADILLMDDFVAAVEAIRLPRFLLVGQRVNVHVDGPLELDCPEWRDTLRALAERGRRQHPAGMDYFVYTRGLWEEIPPFAIGRFAWDNWLIHEARRIGASVVDASAAITALHQDHDYSHVVSAGSSLDESPELRRNRELGKAGLGYSHRDAHWRLSPVVNRGGRELFLRYNWIQHVKPLVRLWRRGRGYAYHQEVRQAPSPFSRRRAAA